MKAFCVNEGVITALDPHGRCDQCGSNSVIPEDLLPADNNELELQVKMFKDKMAAGKEE